MDQTSDFQEEITMDTDTFVTLSEHINQSGIISKCCVCNNATSNACTECGSAKYCSEDCQNDDWKTHKALCHAMKTMPERPSQDHRLGILFAVDKEVPTLVWVHTPYHDDGFGSADAETNFGEWFGSERFTRVLVEKNMARGFELDTLPSIWRLETFVHRENNAAVNGLLNGSPGQPWRGPVLCMQVAGVFATMFEDINLSDFRHIVDFLRT
ncbi:hypothetical protein EV356DRAFT_537482 [Viridothelium virens]|uniref:MYND-type domain-containing protein n=1 Tax=Viridothelium virens TaxID=1048519 RepID=A0A6A6GTQ0_VIRVR|nr:hypothetical protein EV356DRAFT_537482 [Viridothelium virens]